MSLVVLKSLPVARGDEETMNDARCSRFSAAPRMMLLGAGILALVSSAASGCLQASDPPRAEAEEGVGGSGGEGGATSSTSTGMGGSGGTPSTPEDARSLYSVVDPLLVSGCGTCHMGQIDDNFIEAQDEDGRYQKLKEWRSFITPNAADSILLTYPMANGSHPGQDNQHPGTSIDDTAGLRDALTAWLEAEASLIVETVANPLGVGTDPFTPIMGLNAIYLDELAPGITGTTLTFWAEPKDFGLILRDVKVYTPYTTGVTITQPRIVIYPLGVEAESAMLNDDFNNLKQDVPADTANPLGAGMVFLTEYEPGAKLAFHFVDLKPYNESVANDNPCLALNTFKAEAVPQFQANCMNCHGNQGSNANLAMNLVGIGSADDAVVGAICANMLTRVDLATPANSLIFQRTDPGGNSTHQFQFGNNATNFNNFRSEVTLWINAEAAAAAAAGQ